MRFRYLAASGPEIALASLAARLNRTDAPTLVERACWTGFRLWASADTPVIAGPDAALVGLLVARDAGARVAALPARLQPDAEVLARFWGAYVLFGKAGDALRVLRDPSGTVPVHWCAHGALHLWSSDADTLRRAGPDRRQPDIDFVRHWLRFPFLRTERTGVEGVREILPGTVLASSGETQPLWLPAAYIGSSDPHASLDRSAAQLREHALKAIGLLIPPSGDLVLQLSGGLDSSILAGALAQADRAFRAVTFVTRSPDGDERHYARKVASRAGVELIELVEEDSIPNFLEPMPAAFRPGPNALLRPFDDLLSRHYAATGAALVASGAGGDNVFASLNTASPAVDALRARGLSAGLSAVSNVAELHRCTWWRAGRAALRKLRASGRAPPWRREQAFLRDASMPAEPDPHPWLLAASAPPGKREHVQSLVGIQHFLRQPAAGPAHLYPLLAQPLVELCLAIPSWTWIEGGRDRAVARRAFQGIVPDPVLARRSKGRLESMFMRGYMLRRRQIEDHLLGGMLAAHDLIDPEAIRAYLRRPEPPGDADYIRLIEMAAAESWLRSFVR